MMAGFRVIVDLSAYFVDYRQKSLIFIDRESIRNVQNLIDHIGQVFCLENNFEIFISDAHVPRSECADIIQEGDILRVERLTNQPDWSGTSLCNKNSEHEVALDDVRIAPSEKKKKRKASKCEAKGDGRLAEELVSESRSSSVTFTSKPRNKKRKCVNDYQDVSCKATHDSQGLNYESKKGKGKKSASDPKERSKYILGGKIVQTKKTDLDNNFIGSIEFPIEPDKVLESTPIPKNNKLTTGESEYASVENAITPVKVLKYNQLTTEECEDTSVENVITPVKVLKNKQLPTEEREDTSVENVITPVKVLKNKQLPTEEREDTSVENAIPPVDVLNDYNEKGLLSYYNLINESTGGSKVTNEILCETYECNLGSGPVKKRRRQRKRKKPKREGHTNAAINVHVYKPSNSWRKSVDPKGNYDAANNSHIRFSDEDEKEKGREISEVVEVGESRNLGNACSSSVICSKSLEVKDTSISILEGTEQALMVETTLENKYSKKTDSKSVVNNKDKMCQGVGESSMIDGMVVSENDEKCPENSLNCETLVKESVPNGIMNNNESSAHTILPSEKPLSKPEARPNTIFPQNKGKWRRNHIIATGLGATLSQLVKESSISHKKESTIQESASSELLTTLNKASSLEMNPTKNKKDKRYGVFPVLEKFPRRGDILAFKILKMNESYEPVISGYLEGKIMDCDNISSSVTVKVLGGADELKKTNGKFDLEEEEDDNTALSKEKNNQDTLQLQWNAFIEPRLVFP